MRNRRIQSAGATYFFAVNLQDRRSTLLVDCIALRRDSLRQVRRTHRFAIDAWVVLPDPLHAICTVPAGDADYAIRWALIEAKFSRAIAPREFRHSRDSAPAHSRRTPAQSIPP